MGLYIDPPEGTSKEDWLAENGVEILDLTPGTDWVWTGRPDGTLPVVWVQNQGSFSAAVIIDSLREWQRVHANRHDFRERRYYYVPINKLLRVEPLLGGSLR